MKVIFDTNFILTCLKEKVDFLSAEEFGELVLPLQVIDEIRKISEDKKRSRKERDLANLALKIIDKNKGNFVFINLNKKFVDKGLVNYINRESEVILASLDIKLIKKIRGRAQVLGIRKGRILGLVCH